MTTDELRTALETLDARFAAHELTLSRWFAAYAPLAEAYRRQTGRDYASGQMVIDPVQTRVHHNRARSHGRVR